jgi:hypothetical protein
MSVDKMSVGKMSVGKMSVDKMSVDKMSVDKMSVDKMSVDKMSVDKMSVDKMSIDKAFDVKSITCQFRKGSQKAFDSGFGHLDKLTRQESLATLGADRGRQQYLEKRGKLNPISNRKKLG